RLIIHSLIHSLTHSLIVNSVTFSCGRTRPHRYPASSDRGVHLRIPGAQQDFGYREQTVLSSGVDGPHHGRAGCRRHLPILLRGWRYARVSHPWQPPHLGCFYDKSQVWTRPSFFKRHASSGNARLVGKDLVLSRSAILLRKSRCSRI